MKIVFASNYFNHHQQPLSEALFKHTHGAYHFIATEPMPRSRINLGYGMETLPAYVLLAYENHQSHEKSQRLINEADVVIAGSAPESMLRARIWGGKLIFRYSERPLKDGFSIVKYLPRLVWWHIKNPPGKPVYMLCASAYTASDYAKFGLFKGKSYKWGYFPEAKRYQSTDIRMKEKNPSSIVWAGRFIDWKHPDDAVEVARRLKSDGYDYSLTMIGMGPMEQVLRDRIEEYGLQDYVTLPGSMKPEQVREYMERAGIYLFTSDRQEGWGAVLNESMNSGCAVIGSNAIGAVPYLVRDGINGLVYRSGNVDELYERVKYLLDHPDEQCRLGTAAYHTITGSWNAETAAERLVTLADRILSGDKFPDVYAEGVCSKDEGM